MRTAGHVWWAASLVILAAHSSPQATVATYTRRPIKAVRASTPPVMDGVLTDDVWRTAARADTFVDQQSGVPVADQTTAYIAYDDAAIYVAFDCKDPQPERISARETVRDLAYGGATDPRSEDGVEFSLDPFSQHRSGDRNRFYVNAIGTRSSQVAGGRGAKREWSGEWDARTARAADGWTVEMRIPWAILNYPSSKEAVTMGVNFARAQSRTRIVSTWSHIGPQEFYDQDGQWAEVKPPAGAFRPSVSVLPYVLAGAGDSGQSVRSGVNARWSITPELTAVGTANPDFGTVERAVEGIQFSRGERFVPERRPFFQEGARYFDSGSVQVLGLYYYTTRIPTFDLGANVYGKTSGRDTVALVHTVDIGNRSDTAARFGRQLTPTSGASLTVLNRSAPGDDNTVALAHHEVRWGKLLMDQKLAFTQGDAAGGGAQELALVYFDKVFTWAVGGGSISPIFRDANGLFQFTGYKGGVVQGIYNAEWRKGWWRNGTAAITPIYFVHTDGRPFQRGVQSVFSLETRSDWRIGLQAVHMAFDDQTDSTVNLSLTCGASSRVRSWGLSVETGRQGGSPSTFIQPFCRFRILRKLDVTYSGSILNLAGVTQQHIGTLNYEIAPSRSVGGRVVAWGSSTNWYLQYHNSGEKGAETYFIIGDPNAPRFVSQAIVKMVFAM